jgi:glutamine synthetase
VLRRSNAWGWGDLPLREPRVYLFNQSYLAFASGYNDLPPSSDYRIDYHLLQPTRDEPLMRALRNGMTAARVPVESSKGEWSRGQHEVNFTHAEPLDMADMHVLFKQGAKEMAAQHGKAVSFMAKYARPRQATPPPPPEPLEGQRPGILGCAGGARLGCTGSSWED